ncbi:MAG TPA: LysM domain-containing protein [Nocardioidaceae bacterium]|jgi:LysM repeat protein
MSTATIDIADHRDTAHHRPVRRVSSAGETAALRRSARASAPLRLTRRGRLVVLIAVLAVTFAVFTFVGGPAVSTGDTHHAAQHTVVVASGETLWDIASRIAPAKDPRSVIADIVDLNNLADAGSIRVGQQLFVPAY